MMPRSAQIRRKLDVDLDLRFSAARVDRVFDAEA